MSRLLSSCLRGHRGIPTDEKQPFPQKQNLHPPRFDSVPDHTNVVAAPIELPPPLSQEQEKTIDQRKRVLRSEMTRDQTFEGYLAIVSRHDAPRMAKGIDRRTAQIARSESSRTQRGHAKGYETEVATEKLEAIRYLQPGLCQVCQKEGKETDKVVRTCAGPVRKHWYHEKCLQRMFLEAAEDEHCMPPTCCGLPISEALGFQFLSDEQIRSFKDKREEKDTTKRTYCPVSSCGQFIPSRIIEKCIDERVKSLKELRRKPKHYVSGTFRCPRYKASICLICAAPTLVSLEDHYKLALAGELEESNVALDRENPTSKAIASSLDVNHKLEPNKPVTGGSTVAAGKRKMSVFGRKKATTSAR
ncbi:MAG: hypothetical protein Q9226_007465 [Calogaya cf. arnoldii]